MLQQQLLLRNWVDANFGGDGSSVRVAAAAAAAWLRTLVGVVATFSTIYSIESVLRKVVEQPHRT